MFSIIAVLISLNSKIPTVEARSTVGDIKETNAIQAKDHDLTDELFGLAIAVPVISAFVVFCLIIRVYFFSKL